MNIGNGKLIIISGAPGVGKSTTAEALVKKLKPVIEISTDSFRYSVLPYAFPWDEPEGTHQLIMGVESACSTARIYLNGGYNVVINDVFTPKSFQIYQSLLNEFSGISVLLQPSLDIALSRNDAREKNIPPDEIARRYNALKQFDFDFILDNSNISIDKLTKQILVLTNSTKTL